MPLSHLVYASSAVSPFSKAELITLLERSRTRNQENSITGMLLYRDGSFMQVLEGEEKLVQQTHARISADPRHRGLLTLLKGPIETRAFAEWSMGFYDLDSPEVRKIPGYSEFMNVGWRSAEMISNPGRALRLLNVFRQSIR